MMGYAVTGTFNRTYHECPIRCRYCFAPSAAPERIVGIRYLCVIDTAMATLTGSVGR
jgi:hypothetical protein